MIKKMRSINVVLLALIVLLIGLLGYVALRGFTGEKEYVGVYTITGDLYFGRMSFFPRNTLTDVHLLQQTNDQERPLALQKLENTFWEPVGTLKLNDDQIVWTAKLRKDSQIVKYIEGEIQPQNAGVPQSPVPQSQEE